MLRYTLFKADGTTEDVGEFNEELHYTKLQELVGGRIEVIPRDYWVNTEVDTEHTSVVFGYEEARFENQPRNPFFNVLHDADNNPWDVLGNCVREEKL